MNNNDLLLPLEHPTGEMTKIYGKRLLIFQAVAMATFCLLIPLIRDWGKQVMNLELFGSVVVPTFGAVTTFALFFRVLSISEEFPEEDGIVNDPVSTAVSDTVSYEQFKADNWKAFTALWAAMQFRSFYCRFRPLLAPTQGPLCAIFLLVLYSVLYVFAFTEWHPIVQGVVGGVASIINVSWIALIEWGKKLKNTVERLKIS